jgi:hypothetical protein
MKSQNVIVLIIIAIVGAIIFWKREEIKQRFGFGTDSSAGSNGGSGSGVNPSPSPTPIQSGIDYQECRAYPIKLGCKGNYVLNLQKGLNKAYKAGITEDGYFGPQTEAALLSNGYKKVVELTDMARITRAMV